MKKHSLKNKEGSRVIKTQDPSFVLARNQQVTEFWDKVYDFADEYYNGVFMIHGKRGLQRSGYPGQWITISCNNMFDIQIKNDRGYTDLEIKNYADKFEIFCNLYKR